MLFLVNASETMLEVPATAEPSEKQARGQRERGRPYVMGRHVGVDPQQKRANPNWQRTIQTVEQMLTALPHETRFRVALFYGDQVEHIGGRGEPSNRRAIADVMARLRSATPRGGANLEAAFGFVSDALPERRPDRIVLITHGLPTTSLSSPGTGEITEAQRIRCFELATKRLPPRIPVHTVLLSGAPGDPGAAGRYWELANATHSALTNRIPSVIPSRALPTRSDSSTTRMRPKCGWESR